MGLTGSALIHEVGKRILGRYLQQEGGSNIQLSAAAPADPLGVDVRRMVAGRPVAAKVKVDVYCGTDPAKCGDRALTFYRSDTASYAFEAIADTAARTPGWILSSMADELLYYRIAVSRPEPEVAALFDSPDAVFFSELGVDRDDLRVLPMRHLRTWFERSNEQYPPRPVITPERSAWYRIVPMAEVESVVAGIRVVGPVYARLRMGL